MFHDIFTEIFCEIETSLIVLTDRLFPLVNSRLYVKSINYKVVIIVSDVNVWARTSSVSFRDLTRFRDLRCLPR